MASPGGRAWGPISLSADGPSCVEVAFINDTVTVHDTKNRNGGTLILHRTEWTTFINGIKTGDFNNLA